MAAIERVFAVLTAGVAVIYLIMNLVAMVKRMRNPKGPWLPLLLLLAVPSLSDAACSGSGLTWSCTAGSTAGQINTAISSASDEATITLAAGTYTFTGVALDGRNGISIVCATALGCDMTGSDTVFSLSTCSSNLTNLIRISGFKFTGSPVIAVWIYCNSDIEKLRLDHLEFDDIGLASLAIFLGEGSDPPSVDLGHIYGVIDHVNCHGGANNFVCMKNVSGGMTWTTGTQGSANALFFEDNICNFTGRNDFGTGCIDNWRAQSTVARFNTVVGTVLRDHSYCHGGPQSMEVYGNDIDTSGVSSPGFWDVHLQGAGENAIWGNHVTSGSTPLALQSYRSDNSQLPQGGCQAGEYADGTRNGVGTPADPDDGNRSPQSTYYGYPYWHQPGRDGDSTLKPVYSFLNRLRLTDTLVNVSIESGTWTGLQADCANNDADRVNCHIQKDRDIYLETASFTGASGVGVGTLASRPSTCTPTPESADAGNGGVGYWATDQGSWNQSTSNPEGHDKAGADGVLYRCSATNTWTVAYTPYTYPHPLQGQSPSSPSIVLFLEWGMFAVTAAWHFRRAILAACLSAVTVSSLAWGATRHLTYQATTSVAQTTVKVLKQWRN